MCENTKHRALILGSGCLPSLFKSWPCGPKRSCPRDHMISIGLFYRENKKSSGLKPQGLIFGMYHDQVDFYQVCSKYGPGLKSSLAVGPHVFHRLIWKNNLF